MKFTDNQKAKLIELLESLTSEGILVVCILLLTILVKKYNIQPDEEKELIKSIGEVDDPIFSLYEEYKIRNHESDTII